LIKLKFIHGVILIHLSPNPCFILRILPWGIATITLQD